MKRSPMPGRSAPMARTAMARTPARIDRRIPAVRPVVTVRWPSKPKPKDWTEARAKVNAEGVCRCGCGRFPGDGYSPPCYSLQAAHVLGQRHDSDGKVRAVDVVPLTEWCHLAYDAHELDLLPHLTDEEWAAAVELVGEGSAERRVMGAAWREPGSATLADAARTARGGPAPAPLRGYA